MSLHHHCGQSKAAWQPDEVAARCAAVANSLNKFLRITTSLPATIHSRLWLLLTITLFLTYLYEFIGNFSFQIFLDISIQHK